MMLLSLVAVGLGAATPLAISRSRTPSAVRDPLARGVAFYTMLGGGALSLLTGSRLLGALALGSGGAWIVMKGDDVIRSLP